MNLQALTYYCEQCEEHSLGDSCLLHSEDKLSTALREPVEDWETELLQAWKENRPDDIAAIVRQYLEETEEKAYEEGVSEGKSEGYAKGLNDGFTQAKSEMIEHVKAKLENVLDDARPLEPLIKQFIDELEK